MTLTAANIKGKQYKPEQYGKKDNRDTVIVSERVDPIKYGLLFERFLNPERISMPDFDVDFCYERRQEVIDYVARKYGRDHVSQIITFGTMSARMVIRDVGRALDFPYAETDKLAKITYIEFARKNDKILRETKKGLDMIEKEVDSLISDAAAKLKKTDATEDDK